ncbi:MAG: methyltransferase type 12 [Pseudomonadota bacterium]|uniref:hypothetical protein n=1 Tax=Methylophaga aminisulfidivorans TaxID=230105 RepID=UPI0024E22678|nr:hypothetical protein [Methylophaga aminisulfidivorans]MEC9413067.1 methyltransferase type 12 [Pseudomonadota bacterium]
MSHSTHWDAIFNSTPESSLGWYEQDYSLTLSLLEKATTLVNKQVFIPGVGVSRIVDTLLDSGSQVIINDISLKAINHVLARVLSQGRMIEFYNQTISTPLTDLTNRIDIWLDRAVLHFLTDEYEQNGYLNNLNADLKVGGYALFAEFASHGAEKCAGLKIKRYSLESLTDFLGKQFELVDHLEHTYINPDGSPRPYLYALYKRIQ